jgi:hypothetical protein
MYLRLGRFACALLLVGGGGLARADYLLKDPTQPLPAPVHVMNPVEGSVEVRNLPAVQDVRIVGGKQDEPLEVRGEVGLRVTTPLQVEVVNPAIPGGEAPFSGPIKVDDTQPLRVWIDNPWNPASAVQQDFAAYAFQGRFSTPAERQRRLFSSAPGRIFHLTDLVVDGRPEAHVRARLVVRAQALVGRIEGAGTGEAPLAVVDTRHATSARLVMAVPISGDFAIDVEGISQTPGSPFSAIAIGYFTLK